MHIGFLNPQGNFDSGNSHITKHPDFGGQLIYVKQVAIAIAEMGHQVDILTRQIIDPEWPEFAETLDTYPGIDNVRIIRLPAGPKEFLAKEFLWSHLVTDWVPNILEFYQQQGGLPDAMTAHHGNGGLCGVLIKEQTGIPFTFTAHSLGAQKMDKLEVTPENLTEIDEQFHFRYRILAERLSMNRSAVNITSTRQERFEQYSHRVYSGAVDVDNDNRFAVIPPGADFSIFGAKARSENEEATKELIQERLARDIAEARRDLPVILASSRLELKKNILGLVQAFAMSPTLQERANLMLITGGLDDPLREETSDSMTEEVLAPIREVVQENDLWGKVSAFGLSDQSQESLAAAYRFMVKRRSVFALTALYEPFGLAPLEAAVAGLPVVATKNGGPSESFRQGNKEYGVLVDPEDPADIARGLERLLCDANEWEYFAQAGQQRVLKKYTSWESTGENYLSLLEQILSSPETRPRAELLPIHSYFSNPESQTDVFLEELSDLYFGTNQRQQVRSTELEQSPEAIKIKTRRWYFQVVPLPINLAVGKDLILNLNFTPDSQLDNSIRVPANTLELTIYIEASGFYLQGEHTRTLPVKDGKLMERNLTLNLTPLVSGDHTINLSIYPGGRLPNLSPEKLSIKVRVNTPTVLPNIPELIDRRAIPEPEPDVILYVTLEEVLKKEQLTGLQRVGLYLTCPALSCDRQPLEPLHFTANELERLRQFAIQAAAVANGSPIDVLTSLQAMGATLFDRLMPPGHLLRTYYDELFELTDSDTPLSLLIVSEAKAVLPWELVCAYYDNDKNTGGKWYDEFLAQKFILAHWVGYQGLKLANEAPLLELGLTHYNQRPEHLSRWQKVLGSQAQAKSNQQSGLLYLMEPNSSCYGLHILRYTDLRQTGQITSYETNTELASGKTLNQAEELLYNQRLDFTLRRPVVGLSLVDGQTANRGMGMAMSGSDNQLEADWMLPLMHAGASALVGSRWSVLPESDRLFYRTFYNLMRSGRELGSAVWQARKDVRLAFPHRSDWLAYTYFGHPQCQPYLIRPSQGFTFFEAINPPENEKFLAGESYDFRASYRTEAPVWYSGRLSLQEISKEAEDLSVMIVRLTGEMPPEFYQLEPVASKESYQHFIAITMPSKEMILPLLIRFQKGSEELNTLFLNLNVVDRGQS